MDQNYGYYNNAHVDLNEIFNHRRTPMPNGIDDREIEREEYDNNAYNNRGYDNRGYNDRGYDNHGYNYQQMYYNNDHHYDGHRDYDRNDRNNRGNYVREQIPFPMDREELVQVSVSIQLNRLNSTRNFNSVCSTLEQNYQLDCSIGPAGVLTVTGSVSRSRPMDGQNEFLNIVRRVSGDSRAHIVHR